MAALFIQEFTDPGCPWAFSAEPRRQRLRWRYGDALRFERRMIGLSSDPGYNEGRGFTADRYVTALRQIQERFGMPIDVGARPRVPVTIHACRAVVAARLHGASGDDARLLRRLRVRGMGGEPIDEPATIERCARDAGLDPERVRDWCARPDTEAALGEDLAAAREPLPAARHLDEKLASWGEHGGRRYTCPSYVVSRDGDGREISAPGFQPVEVYEVIVANLAPELLRRDPPQAVGEVLAWAQEPLATAEVAAICEREPAEVRDELERIAVREDVGVDAYWRAG